MAKNYSYKTLACFFLLTFFVVGMSVISGRIWNAKPEKISIPQNLIIEREMTIDQFGKANSLSGQSLKEIFDLKSKTDLENKISGYGTADDISSLVTKKLALSAEESGKNWKKIAVKFILWLLFLLSVFIYFKNHKVTPKIRNVLLLVSVSIFGIVLGSDPSPMGTVKDAVYLFATAHTFFPPRMIALIVFLTFVFLANKYICAWGCQAGTLQELIFRLNRNDHDRSIILKQIKLPFIFTNSFRTLFFAVFTFIAFLWGFDIIDPVDFFKIYKPEHIVLAGGVLTSTLLTVSLFIYRPWCHLFCPFGLAGWLVEKISLVKINVDYGTCIACKKCSDACPSTVMSAILLRNKKTIPDCFACYTCRDVCPTGSIEFSARKRVNPPIGHFDKKNKMKGKNQM